MPITEGGNFTPHNKIVSPGVFSRENDLSGIAQGVADIGAVVVAPFPKGPGFIPTVCESPADLESKFGVADGTYYGPYTAMEYLKAKGFVTVCRVGSLTGYHQKFPYIIYAKKGTWLRGEDAGTVDAQASYVTNGTVAWETITSSVDVDNYTAFTGSVVFTNSDLNVTFATLAASAAAPFSVSSLSGSLLYNNEEVSLGKISGRVNVEIKVTSSVLNSGSAASSVLQFVLSAESGSGLLTNVTTSAGVYPFDDITIISGSVTQDLGTCADPIFYFGGVITGSFGPFTGEFDADDATFDPCSGSWSDNTEYKIIAVLADTQNAPINTSLEAPGFSGSTMVTASQISGSGTVSVSYNLTLTQTSASSSYGVYNFSFDSGNTNYIKNVFGSDATAGDPAEYAQGTKLEAAYLYKFFENSLESVVADPLHWQFVGAPVPAGADFVGEPMNFTDEYSLNPSGGDSAFALTNAYTPWVVSQEISPWNGGSPTRYSLFQVWTLSDGTITNTSFKIEISNVKLAGQVVGSDWGSFTLTVRNYSDTDRKPSVLESFQNLSLNPDSANFIARRIGSKYSYIRYDGKIIEVGDFDNLSRYIRIEMSPNPIPNTAVPYGFQEYAVPVNSSAGYWCAPMKYSKASVYGEFPGKYPSGVVFDDAPTGADAELSGLYPTSSAGTGVSIDNRQYFAPLPSFVSYPSISAGQNVSFALDQDITANGVGTGSFLEGSNIIPSIFDPINETTHVKMRKFVFGFQGGFDGQSPAIPIAIGGNIVPGNTQGLNCATSTTAGSIAYVQCVNALGNADEFDINLIVTPGIIYSLHPYVVNRVLDMCETRGDCFYIPDLYLDDGTPQAGQIDEVVSLAGEFDTNYAGAYYPWIKIKNIYTNKIEVVPPSVVIPAVYASNDKVAGEWWAAAGLNRGGIPQAVQVTDRTTHSERDTLYEGRVNPIAAFPGQGISVWGQKTLQVASSALDRINVRRLLIEIKKFFATTSRYLVFEQNTAATRLRFLSIVNPYLESIQQRSGLYAFQVVMDESNNTPDLVDRNILYGQIWLKPTKSAEFIILDFNILPTGATFPTA
jgi:hypothetical protein